MTVIRVVARITVGLIVPDSIHCNIGMIDQVTTLARWREFVGILARNAVESQSIELRVDVQNRGYSNIGREVGLDFIVVNGVSGLPFDVGVTISVAALVETGWQAFTLGEDAGPPDMVLTCPTGTQCLFRRLGLLVARLSTSSH